MKMTPRELDAFVEGLDFPNARTLQQLIGFFNIERINDLRLQAFEEGKKDVCKFMYVAKELRKQFEKGQTDGALQKVQAKAAAAYRWTT